MEIRGPAGVSGIAQRSGKRAVHLRQIRLFGRLQMNYHAIAECGLTELRRQCARFVIARHFDQCERFRTTVNFYRPDLAAAGAKRGDGQTQFAVIKAKIDLQHRRFPIQSSRQALSPFSMAAMSPAACPRPLPAVHSDYG